MAGVDGCNSRLKWRGVFAGERPLAEVWTLRRCGVDQGSVDFVLANPAQPNHCNSSRCMPLCNMRNGARSTPYEGNPCRAAAGAVGGPLRQIADCGTRYAMKTALGGLVGKGLWLGPVLRGPRGR